MLPPDLEQVIQQFYAYASGDAANPPRMSPPILNGIKPAPVKTPRSGVASVGTFKKDRVATVKMNDDIFLLVHNGDGWRIVGGKWPSISVPARWGPSPRLVAVVGSDARPGEDMLTTRTDSIHFVGLDGKGNGGIVGVPRDSWVPIAGGGRSKINAALSWGGPEGMMQTFRDLSGLPLEGYVMTGFAGFEEMISSVLGGFELVVPYRMKDQASKADFEAGRQVVDGDQALAFARTRKSLPNGDFDRSFNQGRIMLDVLKNLKGRGYMAIPKLLELSEPFMMTDLGPEQLLTFAAQTIAVGGGSDTQRRGTGVCRFGRAGQRRLPFGFSIRRVCRPGRRPLGRLSSAIGGSRCFPVRLVSSRRDEGRSLPGDHGNDPNRGRRTARAM